MMDPEDHISASFFPLSSNYSGDPTRAAFPRQLIVYDEKESMWSPTTEESILARIEYLAVSYRQSDFPNKVDLERSIRSFCLYYRLNAYWIDYSCIGVTEEEKNWDLYRIADVFRGAKITLIMIAGNEDRHQSPGWLSWGDRIWTLPEALLSQVLYCKIGDRREARIDRRKVAIFSYRDFLDEIVLVDMFDGRDAAVPITEKIELLRKSIWKRSRGPDKNTTDRQATITSGDMPAAYPAERVYALMGFLPYRIKPNKHESEDTAFSRLMKANKLDGHRFSWDIVASESFAPHPKESAFKYSTVTQLQRRTLGSNSEETNALRRTPSPMLIAEQHEGVLGMSRSAQRSLTLEIADCRTAVHFTPKSRPEKRAKLLDKLALLLEKLYDQTHEIKYLNEAIAREEETIQLTQDNDSAEKARYHNNIGILYQKRYHLNDIAEDFVKAISNTRAATRLTDVKNPIRVEYLSNLGWYLQVQFEKSNEISDIEESVKVNREAVNIASPNFYAMQRLLANLAIALSKRYEKNNSTDDLNEIIEIRRKIVCNEADSHVMVGECIQLSRYLFHRFQKAKNPLDLNETIDLQIKLVDMTIDSDTEKAILLDRLILNLGARYKNDNHIDDLDKIILYQGKALYLNDTKDRLQDLCKSLERRFESAPDEGTISHAIKCGKQAIRLLPNESDDKHQLLLNLAVALQYLYKKDQSLPFLDEAIVYRREVANHAKDEQIKLAVCKQLSRNLHHRFNKTGNMSDIDEAIKLRAIGLNLTSNGSSDRKYFLDNLGFSFQARYEKGNDVHDLDEAIVNMKQLILLTENDSSSGKALYLTSLGSALSMRFGRLHNTSDINEAITHLKDALRIIKSDERLRTLTKLADALYKRYTESSSSADLEEIIEYRREVLDGTVDVQKKIICCAQLARNLHHRFNKLKNLTDINEAIQLRMRAVNLDPDTDLEKPQYCADLALSFLARYSSEKNITDLNELITYRERALRLLKDGSSRKPIYLDDLANSLSMRFDRLHNRADILYAITLQKEAIRLASENHPKRSLYTENLRKLVSKRPQD